MLPRQLSISPSSKSLIPGFYDPSGKDNYLEVYYTYMDRRHRRVIRDDEPLDIPSAKDALRWRSSFLGCGKGVGLFGAEVWERKYGQEVNKLGPIGLDFGFYRQRPHQGQTGPYFFIHVTAPHPNVYSTVESHDASSITHVTFIFCNISLYSLFSPS